VKQKTKKVIKPNHLHILKIKDKEGDFLYYIQEADKLTTINKWFNLIQIEGDKIILPIKAKEFTISLQFRHHKRKMAIRST